jgi:2-polyprenyl-6-methoxyphenol hydroxylase-like FAD-dependent oxidoreductase
MKTAQVIIIGAGPVGLMLANFLGDEGIRVLVLDRRTAHPPTSQAIGVTPPSLHLFARLGLTDSLIPQGVKIQDCHVHGQGGYLGCASFRKIDPPYRYILSLPQRIHMQALEDRLTTRPSVTLLRGMEVHSVTQAPAASQVTCLTNDGEFSAEYLLGCDGHRSLLRQAIGIKVQRLDYGCHFMMGDFTDHSPFREEAHLWFTAAGAVESFPLPQGLRRWIVQTPQPETSGTFGQISQHVHQRTGHLLPVEHQLNQTHFSPWRLDCTPYHQGRLILCGDAAHVMSPIGGQGMNTGWADAEFLAQALIGILQGQYHAAPVLAAYEKYRRRAATVAATRAARGMWLGTRTGPVTSLLRDLTMRHLLFKGPLASHLGPFFSMQTIPFRSLDQVPASVWENAVMDSDHRDSSPNQ